MRVPQARAAHSPPEHSCTAPGRGSYQGEAGRVRVRDSGEWCTGDRGGAWTRLLRRASTKSCSTQMAARWSAGDLDVLRCGERNAAELCLPWKARRGGEGSAPSARRHGARREGGRDGTAAVPSDGQGGRVHGVGPCAEGEGCGSGARMGKRGGVSRTARVRASRTPPCVSRPF